MAKLRLDKYYTSPELAQYCVSKAKEIIGGENITEYLEPSAGSGVFLDYLTDKPYLAYDIEPEDLQNRIIKQDYLSLQLEYKKGRLCIGNPPFGERNNLSVKFYKKAIKECDYIALILPISQLNNNQQLYEFDMAYSEDLGIRDYGTVKVHCCLNIYKRPLYGCNTKPNYKLKDITIFETRINKKQKNEKLFDNIKYDIKIIAWGEIGKELKQDENYVKMFYIKINNLKYKDKILELLRTVNWTKEYIMTATPNLLHWQVYKYLKEQIPELE